MYVHSGVIGMLVEFLHAEQLNAPLFQLKLQEYQQQEYIVYDVWLNLLDELARLCPRPALGLYIGQQAKIAHAGILAYLSSTSGSIGEIVAQFERFARLIYDVSAASIEIDAHTVRISWGSERVTPGQLADETSISAFLTIMRGIAGQDIYPSKVNFINPPPADTQQYAQFFQCPVTFGGIRTIVEFPTTYLNIPLQKQDSQLFGLLEAHAELLLSALPTDQFESSLRALVTQTVLEQRTPTLAFIAQQMHISTRTLQRRLHQHGIKLQEFIASVKLALFQQYRKDQALSLSDIALLLGYTEQSALTRAVKRWTGELPKNLKQ